MHQSILWQSSLWLKLSKPSCQLMPTYRLELAQPGPRRCRAGCAVALPLAWRSRPSWWESSSSGWASPSPTQTATNSPAFVYATSRPTAVDSNGLAAIVGPPPGLDALPPPAASPSLAPTPPVDAPSVTVLNETRTQGLAAKEADRIRSAGWNVTRVTNVNDIQPATTVYYDPSQEAAAKALIAAVPSVKVALPRPHYFLRTGGLIVIVAADAN